MKKQIKSLLCGLCAAALALGCAGCGGSAGPEVPAKVTDIMVWTYYNGDQLESFTSLVEQFNETVGAQKGIKVSTESQGSVNELETSVMDSAEGKVGAAAMPNIFSAHNGRVMAYEALMRSDMERLRSPATIMKLAREQGALQEIERLTFFKSMETFDHLRSMQIIAEGVETAEELKKVLELGVDGLQGYFLAKPANIPTRIAPAARQIIENSHSSDCG